MATLVNEIDPQIGPREEPKAEDGWGVVDGRTHEERMEELRSYYNKSTYAAKVVADHEEASQGIRNLALLLFVIGVGMVIFLVLNW